MSAAEAPNETPVAELHLDETGKIILSAVETNLNTKIASSDDFVDKVLLNEIESLVEETNFQQEFELEKAVEVPNHEDQQVENNYEVPVPVVEDTTPQETEPTPDPPIEEPPVESQPPVEPQPPPAPPQKTPKKRRRRILVDESDEDSSIEEERQEVLRAKSPTPPPPEESRVLVEEVPELPLPENERPKPLSKKSSTQLLNKLHAQSLLQNAILIPAGESSAKKRRKRVLDSEDEASEVDLDGIGMTEDDLPADQEILLSENITNDPNFIPLEGVQLNEMEEIVPIENPILPQDEETETDETIKEKETEEEENEAAAEEENPLEPSLNPMENLADNIFTDVPQEPTFESTVCAISNSNNDQYLYGDQPDEVETPVYTNLDAQNPSPSPPLPSPAPQDPKTEVDHLIFDPEEAESFVQEALKTEVDLAAVKKEATDIKPNVSEISFSQPSSTFWGDESSSDGVEAIPNDVYFGTPDHRLAGNANRSRNRTRMTYKTKTTVKRRRKREESESEDSFVTSGSDCSSEYDYKPKKKKRQAVVSKAPRPRKKVLKQRARDRFFDRSLLVPNEIYFGDVQVPLHVLHSYNSDALPTSSDSDSDNVYRKKKRRSKSRSKSRTSTTYSSTIPSVYSPDGDASIQTMKNYLKMAGIKKVKFNRIWEGCRSNKERADAILDLLRAKGLKGEPTAAKCRELRKKLQAKKEIEELDTSVILDNEDGVRTRRSRRGQPQNTEKSDPQPSSSNVEVAENTLKKLRKVIDSDSDEDEDRTR